MEPNQFVVSELGDLPPGQVVDLAGGEGRNALWLASKGWQAENVEFSKVALEKYIARAGALGLEKQSRATHADAKHAKFQLKPDLLLICYLQLPWAELEQALDNALEQLGDGEIFGVWHALRNVTEGFGGPPLPELNVDPDKLRSWAESRGLIFDCRELERRVSKDGAEMTAIDVQLRARKQLTSA